MRRVLLGITKQAHRERAELVTSSARRLTVFVWMILFFAGAGWAGHALGWISLMPWSNPKPPPEFLRAIGHIDSPNFGSSGFMVDERHFLTTKTAVSATAKAGDTVSIRFLDDSGKLTGPISGKVNWISPDKNGFRLITVELNETRTDYAILASTAFSEAERCAATGFTVDPTGETRLATQFARITGGAGFLQADWGSHDPPLYEGFVLTTISDFAVKGLLSEGIGVVPVAASDLSEAGVRF